MEWFELIRAEDEVAMVVKEEDEKKKEVFAIFSVEEEERTRENKRIQMAGDELAKRVEEKSCWFTKSK